MKDSNLMIYMSIIALVIAIPTTIYESFFGVGVVLLIVGICVGLSIEILIKKLRKMSTTLNIKK